MTTLYDRSQLVNMRKKNFIGIFILCFVVLLFIELSLFIYIAGPLILTIASTFIGAIVLLMLIIGINALFSWLIAKTIVNRKNKD